MHGGVYTKFGQHIASMNHVLPKEFTETLKVLQDRNPRFGRGGSEWKGCRGCACSFRAAYACALFFCTRLVLRGKVFLLCESPRGFI